MEFPEPLIPGRLIRRYKRFLADVALEDGPGADGSEVVTAHCCNPGAMLGLAEPGAPVWLSRARNPARKLKYSWELVSADGTLVGINTGLPNRLVEEAILAGKVAELAGYAEIRRERRYGHNSRIDLLLEDADRRPCYVEIKNVHLMRRPGLAEFPDSVTKRGAKHLGELAAMVRQGARAVIFYLVQRPDCRHLAVAGDIDPDYGAAFADALAEGVEALVYACRVSPQAIALDQRLALASPDTLE